MDIVMKRNKSGKDRPQEKGFVERRVVRVLPKNDLIRKYIKHQPSKIGWLSEGSVEWPLDSFTRNRLRDGDITIEATPPVPPAPPELEHEQKRKAPLPKETPHN